MTKYIKKRNKTKRHLIKITLELAQRKGLLQLTTSEIISYAHVNRKTFYRYFNNKLELINYIENQTLDKIKHAHAKIYQIHNVKKKLLNGDSNVLLKFLNIIGMNRKIINLLLSKNGDPRFNYQLSLLFQDLVNNAQNKYFNRLTPKEKALHLHYFTGAIMGLLRFWLHNYQSYSKTEILKFIIKMNRSFIVNH